MKTLASMLLSALLAAPALAGEGHDHGGAPAVANANGPQRLPDGSVFLPKPAQRQIGVRTLVAEEKQLPRAFTLAGKVVMDPNAGGRVQPTQPGRLEPGPRGFPTPGQAVRKGEVLAYVVPAAAPLERAGQAAQVAELRAARALAEKRLARLRELADTVPRKEIETAESELASLGERAGLMSTGLSLREALVAPVAGVIASAQAVAGSVVDARELVFEIVDPTRLRIEALAYDPALAADIAGGALAVGSARVPLRFVGAARALREQALPLQFTAEGPALQALAVGQPVQVVVQTRSQLAGVPVPAAAIARNPSNQSIVWVKVAPERFEPRVLTTEPLDGANVVATSGLKPGDRLVHQGASLVNQIR
ncbi:efflux RND transporter periplasmic adaptor subunit [Pseudorhodoferax sp. Leaf265]|jgi:hypothetical protein|uniref:efflux RND transporter periplasmic adaptor subunit n=1 Tax=Pseudorhodoferax sp. Leaf265 TaxID=1736315 RepID=UPI0006FE1550|nr:HlyD family secretion protein [Pseudorhodoferax sp. Leaf265]KQP13897.1 hypothetical protein ASF45_30845 [Pseudorhodoferax sp. Leaf265]